MGEKLWIDALRRAFQTGVWGYPGGGHLAGLVADVELEVSPVPASALGSLWAAPAAAAGCAQDARGVERVGTRSGHERWVRTRKEVCAESVLAHGVVQWRPSSAAM